MLHDGENGSDLVGEHVRVGGGREPLPGHGDDIQPLRELIEEIGMSRLDLILEGVLAVNQDLVQVLGLVREAEVHRLPKLVRLVPVEDLGLAVVALPDVVDEDLEDLLEELCGRAICLLRRGVRI